jgi:hypothetical protein
MPATIAELRPTERVTTLVGPLTDAQVAHAIRLDHELWDDAAFAAAQILTTPGANRRLLIDRLDQAVVLGNADEELARIILLIEEAVDACPPPEEPTERYSLFEVYEREPGGLALGWYYELLGPTGRAIGEPVGPYTSDGKAAAVAADDVAGES